MQNDANFLDHCPGCMERGSLVVVKATVVSTEEIVYPNLPLTGQGWSDVETGDEEVQCSRCFRIFALAELRVENSAELNPKGAAAA